MGCSCCEHKHDENGRKVFSLRRFLFNEKTMMGEVLVATLIIGMWHEAIAIALFFAVGEMCQDFAVRRSRKNITKLMDIRPDFANLKTGKEVRQVPPAEVQIGATIIVKPGERIPIDGVIISGQSYLDTRAITGESVPRLAQKGDTVLSGTINTESVLEIKTTKLFGQSTVSKILELVENAQSKKSKSEEFITKFARVFTPTIMIFAILVAVLPPLCGFGSYQTWVYRAVIFVAISCPCALVMSIPLGVFGGIGGAARNGILIKGGNYLESLNRINAIAFDKTGTLTKGVFEVSQVNLTGKLTSNELIFLAANAEQHSPHPIAKSIIEYAKKTCPNFALVATVAREKVGHGVQAKVNGKNVLCGNAGFVRDFIQNGAEQFNQTAVYIVVENEYVGNILISDKTREETAGAIADLRSVGIGKIVMLTGDNEQTAKTVASDLGIDYRAGLLPADKVAEFEKIKAENPDLRVAFVGDGMNDAPVLTRADVGIALGGISTDAALEAADIVLMNDDLGKIATAKRIAKKTRHVIIQNICLALGIKATVMVLAFFGFAHIWAAVFADVGVALMAILNATRCLTIKK